MFCQTITIGDGTITGYGRTEKQSGHHHTLRQAHVLRAPASTTRVWPKEYIELYSLIDDTYALESRCDTTTKVTVQKSQGWPPPDLLTVSQGRSAYLITPAYCRFFNAMSIFAWSALYLFSLVSMRNPPNLHHQ